MSNLEVLYEDNHLLIVDKPAGIPTMGGSPGQPSMVTITADWIRDRYGKPGRVFVGVVSRLDSMVSGALVFARTSKAANRLTRQFQERSPEKVYLACVEGRLPAGQTGKLDDYLVKDEAQHRMTIVEQPGVKSQFAQLEYRVLRATGRVALVEVRLLTGRKHQIRVQLAHRGFPVVGDRKYGAKIVFSSGIALHCQRLTVEHPTLKVPITVESRLPESWKSLPVALEFDRN